jgi:polar amino acid transport system substrate-binding protein
VTKIAQIPVALILLVLLGGRLVSAEQAKLTVAFEHWPPMKIVEGGSFGGIDAAILREIANRLDIEFEFEMCSWNRCVELMRSGHADLITSIAKTPDREEFMYFIEPPYKTKLDIAFYMRRGSGETVHAYEDLYRSPIGVTRGSVYFQKFDADPDIVKFEVSNEERLLRILERGRVDLIIGMEMNMDYLITLKGMQGRLEKAPYRITIESPSYIAVSKNSPFLGTVAAPLSAVVSQMVETGEIENIENNVLGDLY